MRRLRLAMNCRRAACRTARGNANAIGGSVGGVLMTIPECHRCTCMELQKKVKTALDETRILILGGQILLGFGLRGVFAEGFDQLPPYVRYLDAVGLGLMVIVLGLLILPEPYHRIVEGGSDSGGFHELVTDIADLVLLPFALALGIDVYIAAERVF